MPQQTASVESLGRALEVLKSMQGNGFDWGKDWRPPARQAVAEIIEM